MGIFKTLGRVLLGFLLASLVAGLIQVLYVDTPAELAAAPSGEFPARAGGSLELALLAATHSAIFGAAFALIAAAISEWLAIRNIVYFLFAGVVIALLGFVAQYFSEVTGQPTILNDYAVKAYLTAGFFAGLVYWLVAGQRAGERGDWSDATVEAGTGRPHIIVEKEPAKKGSLAEKLALRKGTSDANATVSASAGTSVPVTKGPAQKPADAKVSIEVKDKPSDSSEKTAEKS